MLPIVPTVRPSRVADKRITYGAFVLFVILTLVVGFFLFLNFRAQATLQRQVNQSQTVIRQLGDLLSTLQDAEIGQRSYLLTARDSYLEPYNNAVAALPIELMALERSTADESRLHSQFDQLVPIIKSRMDVLQSILDLQRTQSKEAALAMVNTDKGKNLMDQIRSLISAMTQGKSAQLVQDQANARQVGRNTFILAIAAAVLNLTVVGLVFVLLSQENSARRKTEATLFLSQQAMSKISDLSPTMLYVYGLSGGQRLYFNRATADFFGGSPEDFPARSFSSLFSQRLHADDQVVRSQMRDNLHRATDSEIVESEIRIQNDHFEWRWLYCRESVFRRNAAGQPVEIIGTALDITERKLLQEQETERADILRSFIENASHDLNTPITILTTSVDLMKRYGDVLDARMQQLVAEGGEALPVVVPEISTILWRNRRKVLDLDVVVGLLRTRVADMIEMVRIEQESELALAPVELKRLVERSLEICHSQAEARGVTLKFTPTPGKLMVSIDEERMTRALNNLIFNGINFNHEHGMVEVCLECTDHEMIVEVNDNGIGISEEDLPHVFERFYRADKARSMDNGGTGLGLTMTRQIVERHGGMVTITSALNQGTTARIILPDTVIMPAPRVSG